MTWVRANMWRPELLLRGEGGLNFRPGEGKEEGGGGGEGRRGRRGRGKGVRRGEALLCLPVYMLRGYVCIIVVSLIVPERTKKAEREKASAGSERAPDTGWSDEQ